MKTSKMIAMLEENPKLKFRSKLHEITVWDGGLLNIIYLPRPEDSSGSPSGNFRIVKSKYIDADDWQLVREPVPWQEAMQAWADGKEVECVGCMGCGEKCDVEKEQIFNTSDDTLSLCREQLLGGVWYING